MNLLFGLLFVRFYMSAREVVFGIARELFIYTLYIYFINLWSYICAHTRNEKKATTTTAYYSFHIIFVSFVFILIVTAFASEYKIKANVFRCFASQNRTILTHIHTAFSVYANIYRSISEHLSVRYNLNPTLKSR